MRETGHRKPQNLVKVPKELLQLQQKVCSGIGQYSERDWSLQATELSESP